MIGIGKNPFCSLRIYIIKLQNVIGHKKKKKNTEVLNAFEFLCFFFKCHTRFRASAITLESILSIVIFLRKFFTGVWFLIAFPWKNQIIAGQTFAAIRAWTCARVIRSMLFIHSANLTPCCCVKCREKSFLYPWFFSVPGSDNHDNSGSIRKFTLMKISLYFHKDQQIRFWFF